MRWVASGWAAATPVPARRTGLGPDREPSAHAVRVVPAREALDRVVEHPFGLAARLPAAHLAGLVRLQCLVDVEEVPDLGALVLRDVLQILDVVPADVGGRDAEQLGVRPPFVTHPEDRHRPSRDLTAW